MQDVGRSQTANEGSSPSSLPYLAAGVDALQALPCGRVPEAYAAVGSAAAADQQAVLVWRPSDGLDCRLVLAEPQHRVCRLRGWEGMTLAPTCAPGGGKAQQRIAQCGHAVLGLAVCHPAMTRAAPRLHQGQPTCWCHTNSWLSLPPLASSRSSGDHRRPHTCTGKQAGWLGSGPGSQARKLSSHWCVLNSHSRCLQPPAPQCACMPTTSLSRTAN